MKFKDIPVGHAFKCLDSIFIKVNLNQDYNCICIISGTLGYGINSSCAAMFGTDFEYIGEMTEELHNELKAEML